MADSRAQGMAFKEMADEINQIALQAMADEITQLRGRLQVAEMAMKADAEFRTSLELEYEAKHAVAETDRVHAAATAAWAEGFEDAVSYVLSKQDEVIAIAQSLGMGEGSMRSDSTEVRAFLRAVREKRWKDIRPGGRIPEEYRKAYDSIVRPEGM